MHAHLGEIIQRRLTLSIEEISAMATRLGDSNPLHHDMRYAQGTRFGGIIACGPHSSGLLIALTASHYGGRCGVLGLHFTVRYQAPVYPDRALDLVWEVTAVEAKASLNGEIVTLRGMMREADTGTVLVQGDGQVLLTDRL